MNNAKKTEQSYFIGKFSQILGDGISYRASDPKNRTDDDFEILQVSFDEETEFGIQGGLSLWHGTGDDFDWENYNHDDWGASIYFFEFQNFLDFYTAPTTDPNKTKLVLYTPRNDWSGWQSVVVDEYIFSNDSIDDAEDSDSFAELLCVLLNEKYKLIKVSESYIKKYITSKK